MRNKIVILPLFVFLLLVETSFAKMPIYTAKKANPVNLSNIIADQKNSKKLLDYGVIANDESLYLQVNIYNSENLLKIKDSGLKIYFSKGKKKKKDWYLTIENAGKKGMMPPMMSQQPDTARMRMGNQQQQSMMPPQISNDSIKDSPKTAVGYMGGVQNVNSNTVDEICKNLEKVTWTKGVQQYVFYRTIYKDPMSVEFSSARTGILTLTIKMPLKYLEVTPGDMLAIGIENGDGESLGNQMPQGGGMNMGMGGGPGGMGGRPGGMSGGPGMGGSGGGMGGAPMGNSGGMQQKQQSGSALKFWFLTQF